MQLARHWSETPLAALLAPMRRFIEEARTASLLLGLATLAALLLANSPLSHDYLHLLHSPLAVRFGQQEYSHSLLHWVNDGLMTLFFLVVGLEIKREFLQGELSSRRAATLPIVAALGGACVPALIYFALNPSGPASAGWAIPMATDIAFALGALALLGERVPITLKIFLTAIAIVDDLLAVLVIALFYSGSLNWLALGSAALLLLILSACNYFGIRSLFVYGTLGFLVWLGFLNSGVHATLAGVLVAWTIPARTRIDAAVLKARLSALVTSLDNPAANEKLSDQVDCATILQLEKLCEAAQAPLNAVEHKLSQLASLVIIPIFALTNAAVPIGPALAGEVPLQVGLGIVLGLCLGKPLGVMLSCWLVVRAGWAELPRLTNWTQMWGASILTGIGFTMSIFIASLGFTDTRMLDFAKVAVLLASAVSMLCGLLVLGLSHRAARAGVYSSSETGVVTSEQKLLQPG